MQFIIINNITISNNTDNTLSIIKNNKAAMFHVILQWQIAVRNQSNFMSLILPIVSHKYHTK